MADAGPNRLVDVRAVQILGSDEADFLRRTGGRKILLITFMVK